LSVFIVVCYFFILDMLDGRRRRRYTGGRLKVDMNQEPGPARQAHDQEKDGCAAVINDAEHVKPPSGEGSASLCLY
ncbi:hypothetical protein, partial [Enterobacter intestinihominis]